MLRSCLLACCVALLPMGAAAQTPADDPAADAVSADAEDTAALAEAREAFEKTITRRTGLIDVAEGRATLSVPAGYYFLDRADTKKVLEGAWGNPPDPLSEGMLFPEQFSALDPNSWGVVISYEDTGYVSDADAAKINYDDLMRDMRSEQQRMNPELVRKNYPPVEIVGWAKPPRYDGRTHRIYWAKDLIFGDGPIHTLNYDMRVLGRGGVLQLTFVAAMEDLTAIEQASPSLLAASEFKQGFRYDEFDPRTDAKADFGLAGLVAGGAAGGLILAKKTGLIGLLLVFLKKAWVLVVVAFGAIATFFRNLFGGKASKTAKSQALSTDFFDKPPGPPPSDGPPTI